MKKTNINENELLKKGFEKKACIIHPSRVCKEDEFYIGQIDENGNGKELLVFTLPQGFRFKKHIAVNYRREVFLYESGFMAGGIEIYEDINDRNFIFNEENEWIENFKKTINEIISNVS